MRRKPPKRKAAPKPTNPNQFEAANKKPRKRKPPKPKKGEQFYKDWCAAHDHCQSCGIDYQLAKSHRWPGLSTHHIAKAGRVHAATNLLRLCQRCHNSAEGLTVSVQLPDGTKYKYPPLLFAHCHWLKIEREPAEYDAERLRRLRLGHLTEPEAPPAAYLAEWFARAGDTTSAQSWLNESDFPGTLRDLLAAVYQT